MDVRTLGQSVGRLPKSGAAPDYLDVLEKFGRTGYWHIDLLTEIIFFSSAVCSAHGMPPGYRPESLGECIKWYEPEDRTIVEESIRLATIDGEPFSYEARIKAAHGRPCWVAVSGEVRVNAAGEPIAVIGTLSDITVAKSINARLGKALREAQVANRLKDTFLANMSHELRTPLNAIIGFSQVIKMMEDQGKVDQQVGGYASDIENAGAHLLAIIEDIFSLAQMEADAGRVDVESVDIGTLLDDVRSLTGTTSRDLGRQVVFEKVRPENRMIVADKVKMTKVLVNLVSNAIKFSPANAPVRVSTAMSKNQRLVISVADEGPGIPEGLHTKIFERFERLEASKHAIGGIGVGLALARDLVKSMGGEIGVDSIVGEGSTFWLSFPAVQQAERALAG